MAKADAAATAMRIDLFLWQARFAKTRSAAQALAIEGHIRLNGRRIERAHLPVRVGDVLTLPTNGLARVIRVLALPVRRGPPVEARALYDDLSATTPAAMHIDAEPSTE